MPRIQFTLKRMMLAVACVAVATRLLWRFFVAMRQDTALDFALFLLGLALPGAAIALLCNERREMALLTMLSVTFFIAFCLRVSGF